MALVHHCNIFSYSRMYFIVFYNMGIHVKEMPGWVVNGQYSNTTRNAIEAY